MPPASKFGVATPETSGVVASHLRDIHMACRHQNTFLFVRPSTVPTMRLIAAGFATKSMDIHDKSSDWGLTSGLVPVDQAFSKNRSGTPNANIHPHGHGEAQAVHLSLQGSFEALNGQGHFEFMQEVKAGACTTAHGLAKYRHFHCDQKNANVCFLMENATGKAYWHWRAAGNLQEPKTLVPIWVWGYKGTPVTGDYDMWMVAPHVSRLSGSNAIHSNKDAHGRSAATGFTTEFMLELNKACNRTEKPVFNHGAEAQNLSFTQPMDKRLVVFCAGLQAPFTITRVLLPGILHDLLLHGYVVVRNPKWDKGSTLGIEDMADASAQFPDAPEVKAGVAAKNKLEAGAARTILSAMKDGKNYTSDAAWRERFNQLRYFRAVSRMPDPSNSLEALVLPPEAFPISGPGSDREERKSAVALGKSMEASFTRTGFVQEDGHVSPVDASRVSAQAGSVKSAINAWEQRKG